MTVNEIQARIRKIKEQIELLHSEIEKINQETAFMTNDLRDASNELVWLSNSLKTKQSVSQPELYQGFRATERKSEKFLMHSEDLIKLLAVDSYKIGLFYTLFPKKMLLRYNDEFIKLTRKELYLLVVFAANQNVLIERNYLLQLIWQSVSYYNARSMDVYICKLRRYLSNDDNIILANSHGKGYTLFQTNTF